MTNTQASRHVPDNVLRAFKSRLSTLKKARTYMGKNEIPKAVKHYKEYLNAVANYYGINESSLSPTIFNKEDKSTTAEMLLISHVYWDLAKSYDMAKSMNQESQRCLNQFVKFTAGHKFQHVNARMVNKFIKRRRAHNLPAFERAYSEIYVKPKGCYIATACFGDSHIKTRSLRIYKNKFISQSYLGKRFIDLYYFISPQLLSLISYHSLFRSTFNFFIRPAITCILFLFKLRWGKVNPNDND